MRGRGGYWIGGVLIAAAVAGAIIFAGLRVDRVANAIDDYPKTSLSEGSVQLEAREYNVYIDVPGGTGEFRWELSVVDEANIEVPLDLTSSDFTYDFGNREGALVGSLRPSVAGRHRVRGSGPPGARVIFGDEGILGSIGSLVLGALGILVLGGGLGVTLIIVTAVRRRGPQEAKRWP
jgi:hypothetical protein